MILLRKFIITYVFWLWIIIGNILSLLIIIPYYLLIRDFVGCRFLIKKLIADLTAMAMFSFWNIEIIDKRHHKGKGPYVIVCNHVSIVDTLFTALLPFDDIVYTWKKKWSYVPGFGWLCLLANHITIDHSEISRKEALIRAKEELEHACVLFYAEGTRNSSKGLLPFKTGAFRLGMNKKVEIIPITLIGTGKACSSFICDVANIKIIIDEPVQIDDIDQGIKEIRNIMLSNLENIQI